MEQLRQANDVRAGGGGFADPPECRLHVDFGPRIAAHLHQGHVERLRHGRVLPVLASYFPMQNRLKIRSKRSSVYTAPTMAPSSSSPPRSSRARSSGGSSSRAIE